MMKPARVSRVDAKVSVPVATRPGAASDRRSDCVVVASRELSGVDALIRRRSTIQFGGFALCAADLRQGIDLVLIDLVFIGVVSSWR